MCKYSTLLVVLVVLFVGCDRDCFVRPDPGICQQPARLANREEIANHLPAGVTLDTIVSGSRVFVEQELVNVGALLADDGKLRDNAGKEIYFQEELPGYGMHAGDEQIKELNERHQKYYEELRQKYRLILLPNPGIYREYSNLFRPHAFVSSFCDLCSISATFE